MAPPRLQRPVGWLRDLPIWTKLGLIMIVPTIATIVVGTAGLLDKVQAANNADRARTLAVLSGEAGGLVHELQDERAVAVQLLKRADGRHRPGQGMSTPRSTSRPTQANIEYRQSRSTLADIPPNLRALLDSIEGELGELPVLRSEVEPRNKIPLNVAVGRYDVLITDLLGHPRPLRPAGRRHHVDRPAAGRRRHGDGQGVPVPGTGGRAAGAADGRLVPGGSAQVHGDPQGPGDRPGHLRRRRHAGAARNCSAARSPVRRCARP